MLSYLKLIGTDGLSKGEEFFIKKGESSLLGRSSKCDICLADLPRAQEMKPDDKVANTKFRTIDGKHLKIYFKDVSEIILQDLSKNGTYLDGKKLEGQAILKDLKNNSHILLIGLEERFRLELLMEAEEKIDRDKVASQPEVIGDGHEEAPPGDHREVTPESTPEVQPQSDPQPDQAPPEVQPTDEPRPGGDPSPEV